MARAGGCLGRALLHMLLVQGPALGALRAACLAAVARGADKGFGAGQELLLACHK